MNTVSIGFLLVLAGPLLRRFGLRVGIAANPLVMTVFAVGMLAVHAVGGGTSMALLAIVSAARIADIALTDGTTRTSINATYQVLPDRARLPVQTAVEGIGRAGRDRDLGRPHPHPQCPALPLTATIAVTALVCAVWTWTGVRLYRAYGPALVDALERRPLLVPSTDMDATAEDEAVALAALEPGGASHATRLRPCRHDVLADARGRAERHCPGPEIRVRLAALAGLRGPGTRPRGDASRRGSRGHRLGDPAVRLRAATALEVLDRDDRAAAAELLRDQDVTVRNAALESVHAGDAFAVEPTITVLGDPRSAGAAAGAVGRLGDAVVPSMATLLEARDRRTQRS